MIFYKISPILPFQKKKTIFKKQKVLVVKNRVLGKEKTYWNVCKSMANKQNLKKLQKKKEVQAKWISIHTLNAIVS